MFMPPVIALLVYFFPLLLIGLWSGLKLCGDQTFLNYSIASRKLKLLPASLSIVAAIFTGGTNEVQTIASEYAGLVWNTAPVCAFLGLVVSALCFARPMRRGNHVTVFDPFTETYGRTVAAVLGLLAMVNEVVWCAGLLSQITTAISWIADYSYHITMSIILCNLLIYTILGGMRTISHTHMYQAPVILIGLVISLVMAMHHPSVRNINSTRGQWMGTVDSIGLLGPSLDYICAGTMSYVTWQPLYQRILSGRTETGAVWMVLFAAAMYLVLQVPVTMLGIVGASVNWNMTDAQVNHVSYYGTPILLLYLCPTWAALCGLLALIASVVSSVDSSLHSMATIFVNNIYIKLRPSTSDRRLINITRAAIFLLALAPAAGSLYVSTLHGISFLLVELVYIIVFPQFVMALHAPHLVNTYGSIVTIVIGPVLRLLSGSSYLGLDPIDNFPLYDRRSESHTLPVVTLAMIVCWLLLVTVSLVTRSLFTRGCVSLRYDVLRCYNTGRPQSMEFDEIAPGRNVHDYGRMDLGEASYYDKNSYRA